MICIELSLCQQYHPPLSTFKPCLNLINFYARVFSHSEKPRCFFEGLKREEQNIDLSSIRNLFLLTIVFAFALCPLLSARTFV
jgi:hypothetical protein